MVNYTWLSWLQCSYVINECEDLLRLFKNTAASEQRLIFNCSKGGERCRLPEICGERRRED